jgi:hypothetical protein
MIKVLIHQPYKYGDYINLIPLAQKLSNLGYHVFFPHSYHTKELTKYLKNIDTFEIGLTDINASINFCKLNDVILIDCQFAEKYNHLCTVHGGHLFIEEIKYYVAEDILKCGIKYEDKYNLFWDRDINKEEMLKKYLNINNGDLYNVSHLNGDNGRFGKIPDNFKNERTIEITKIDGYTLLDWYGVIMGAKNIFTIQSSVQCFVDCIKNHLNHKNIFLLNDTSEVDRLLVPAYDWDMSFFINKRLK